MNSAKKHLSAARRSSRWLGSGVWSSLLFYLLLFCLLVIGSEALAENRSLDGFGNNLSNPSWGTAGTDFLRIAPAAYGDGVSTPSGGSRPNPRTVSNAVVAQSGSMPNSTGLSDWVFQWGQFIDHDIDLTGLASPSEPFPISIPAGDPVFDPSSTGMATMPFSRSAYNPATGTGSGNPRQQVNSVTSYLDASMIYGSDPTRATALRSFSDGHLLEGPDAMLPYNTMGLPNDTQGAPNPEHYYVAGDVRANEQMGLTAVQTLFMREHNRQADLLAAENPSWTDEQLYQHARKIVGAEIQAITYGEFLPAMLGSAAPTTTSVYNPNVDASIATEFATAFFRFGHSMVSPELLRIENDGSVAPGGPMALHETFFQPSNMGMVDPSQEMEYILKGLATQQQQEIDSRMVDGLRNFLFGESVPGAGMDLAALNIQRGRDHGLPDYNTVREAYGLPAVTSFAEITSDAALQAALQSVYGDVNSIDPWVGGLAEDHVPGMAVGELIAAALIDQFTRLRDGDRFWFLNDDSLSAEEIAWLSDVQLSDIIMLNTDITNLQENVFLAVPEPGGLVLAGIGLLLFVWRGRRGKGRIAATSRLNRCW